MPPGSRLQFRVNDSLGLHQLGLLIGLLEHREGGIRLAQLLGDANRDAVADPPIRPSVRVTLPQRTDTSASARISSGKVSPTLSFISCLSGISLHRARHRPISAPAPLRRKMAFPDRIAAEFFAHEHLQQHAADRLDGRVRQQQLDIAAVLHVDVQRTRIAALAGRLIAAKRGLVSSRSMLRPRRQRPEGLLGVGQHDFDSRLTRLVSIVV